MRFIRLAIWITVFLVFVLHASIFYVHCRLLFMYRFWPSAATYVYGTFVISAGIVLLAGTAKESIRKSKSFSLLCTLFVIPMGACLIWFAVDDPKIQNDYQKKDIAAKANESYSYLSVINSVDITSSCIF